MTNEKESKLIVTEAIAKKFFEKYCHDNDSMAIIELDGERYAYDKTFNNGYGTDQDAGRGDAKALALKIGSEIDEDYFVRKYHIMAPEKALSIEEIEELKNHDSVEWSDFYDDDDLYVKYEDNHYEHIDLEQYVDEKFIKKLGNRENSENNIISEFKNEGIDRELFIKAVVKKHGTDFEAIQKTVDDVVDKAENLNLGLFNSKMEFKAKLLNDILVSDEYKKAFEVEQGKTKEQENTK